MNQDVSQTVGVAVVEHDGRFLVGKRGTALPLPGKDEFPGGRCEAGESPAQCAVRECREETGLAVEPQRLLLNRQFVYAHAAVDLHFWLCRPVDASAVGGDPPRGYRWVPAAELASLDFPEANEPVVALLTRSVQMSRAVRVRQLG